MEPFDSFTMFWALEMERKLDEEKQREEADKEELRNLEN